MPDTRPEIRVRLDPDIALALADYERDVPDYSRNSTVNLALRWWLALESWSVEPDDVNIPAYEGLHKMLQPYVERWKRDEPAAE